MPRPFSFAASFLPGMSTADGAEGRATEPTTNDESKQRIPCAPALSIKFPPLPNLSKPLKREPPVPRVAQCALIMGTGACQCNAPEELIVLAHGLQGEVDDFSYLLDTLSETGPARKGRVLVHASSVNTDRTHDGIATGGERLAYDIRAVIASHPSLVRVSLMGFSLGGLYVRYAAAALYDSTNGTIGGLEPNRIFMVASPNLGVRAFGVYRFLPPAVRSIAHLLIGDTGSELFLEDEGNLLLRMSTDDDDSEPRSLKFTSALASFSHRYLYANTKGDFMVNYGTSALDANVSEVTMAASQHDSRAQETMYTQVDRDYDERGCKVYFTIKYMPEEAREERSTPSKGDEERVMAERLKRVGWNVIAIEFPVALPIAHNRIVAMSRGPLHAWFNSSGRRVVHHLVDTIMEGYMDDEQDGHRPTFHKVSSASLGRRSLSIRSLVPDL